MSESSVFAGSNQNRQKSAVIQTFPSSQAIYPSRITYGQSEITFLYQKGRNDKVSKYFVGEKRYFDRFLKKISTSISGKSVREYNFHYNYSQGSGVLTLKNVQLCTAGIDSNADECSLPLNVEYQPPSGEYGWKPFPIKSSFNPESTTSLRTMDWNRDGFDDLVRSGTDGIVEIRYGGPEGTTPDYETLDSGDEAKYMVTPYISNDGERGLVYLTGNLVQEEYQQVTEEGYIEILDDARWKRLGYSCQVNIHCSTGWISVDVQPGVQEYICEGNRSRSTVYAASSSYNPPDQYGRQWVQRRCSGEPESGNITLQGYAEGFYQEAYEVHPPEYEVIPYDFTSFKYSWRKMVLDEDGSFEYRSLAGSGSERNRLCLDNEFAADFDPQTDLYDPIVGDFDADGEMDIYVAEPACSSPDAKDVPWRKVVGGGSGGRYENLSNLKNATFNYDSNPNIEVIERRDGRFFVHGEDPAFELKTSGGSAIESNNSIPVDVNSDGLTDIVSFGRIVNDSVSDLDNIYVYLNQGAEMSEARVLSFGGLDAFGGDSLSRVLDIPLSEEIPLASRVRVLDYDKNGMSDLLFINGPSPENSEYGNRLILLRGVAAADGEPTFEVQDMGVSQYNTEDLNNRVVVFDADGDGATDILIADGESYNLYGRGNSYNNKATGFITSYPNGSEKKIEVEYGKLNDADVHEFSWISGDGQRTFSSPMSVVSRVQVPTPSGEPGVIEYRYKNAQTDLNGRGFLGFESLTKTSLYQNTEETIYFWGAALPGVSPDFYERKFPEFPYIGRVLAKTVKNTSNGRTIHKSLNIWSAADLDVDGVARPYLQRRVSTRYDLEGSAIGSERLFVELDSYGNRRSKVSEMGASDLDPFKCVEESVNCSLEVVEFSETIETRYRLAHPTFLDDKTVTYRTPTLSLDGRDVTNEKELTSITKYRPTGNWPYVVGESTTSSGVEAADAVREVFSYEPTTTGAARLQSATVESPEFVPSKNQIKDRTDRISEYSHGVFPSLVVNAEGHSTVLKTDYRHGKPLETIDANSLRVKQKYDSLGRLTRVDNPDGSGWVREYEFCEGQACENYSANAAYVVRQRGHDGSRSEVYYDQFSNQVAQVKAGFEGQSIVKKTVFDQRGRKEKESYPFIAGQEAVFKHFTYEDTKDLQSVAFPDGSTEERYRKGTGSGLRIEVTKNLTRDENGADVPDRTIKRTETHNLLGKTVSVSEYKNGSDAVVTQLKHDAKGRLIRTKNLPSDAIEGTIIDVIYDDSGNRKILDDPDTGRTVTTYNSVKEVVEEVQLGLIADNGNSKTFLYEYDRLGRKLKRTHQETGSVDVWYYDVGQEGRDCGSGRLCSKGNSEFSEEYMYGSAKGKLKATKTTIIAGASSEPKQFVFNYGYDQFGRERRVEYPSGFTIRRHYRNGYLSEIYDVTDSSESSQVWSANKYNVYGKTKEISLGNGLTTWREFDERGRVQSIRSGTGTSPSELLQASKYGYDSDGNLTSRVNELSGLHESFNYDGLNRLTTADAGANTWRYGYDDFGNLTQKRGVDDYQYGTYEQIEVCATVEGIDVPGPHAVTKANGLNYCYDEFGNQISSDDRVIEYDHSNKPVSLTQAGHSISYKYGPDGSRFYQSISSPAGEVETYYVRSGLFEVELIGNTVVQNSYVDGIFIDKKDVHSGNHNQYYTLKDHLGSVVSIVDADVSDGLTSSEIQSLKYAAFGKNETTSGPSLTENTSVDDRGFTGHEHIAGLNLIHMNGRVYDPNLGRFISADPLIQAPESSQSYNRYSYVWNNPLSATDPSGFMSQLSDGELAGVDVRNSISPNLVIQVSNDIAGVGEFDVADYLGIGDLGLQSDITGNSGLPQLMGPEVGDVIHASSDLSGAPSGIDAQTLINYKSRAISATAPVGGGSMHMEFDILSRDGTSRVNFSGDVLTTNFGIGFDMSFVESEGTLIGPHIPWSKSSVMNALNGKNVTGDGFTFSLGNGLVFGGDLDIGEYTDPDYFYPVDGISVGWEGFRGTLQINENSFYIERVGK